MVAVSATACGRGGPSEGALEGKTATGVTSISVTAYHRQQSVGLRHEDDRRKVDHRSRSAPPHGGGDAAETVTTNGTPVVDAVLVDHEAYLRAAASVLEHALNLSIHYGDHLRREMDLAPARRRRLSRPGDFALADAGHCGVRPGRAEPPCGRRRVGGWPERSRGRGKSSGPGPGRQHGRRRPSSSRRRLPTCLDQLDHRREECQRADHGAGGSLCSASTTSSVDPIAPTGGDADRLPRRLIAGQRGGGAGSQRTGGEPGLSLDVRPPGARREPHR